MKRSNGAAAARRADDRQGYADRQRAELRQQHQLDRYRQALGDGLQHGLAGAERAAEIALQHIAEPAQIAPPDRLVQPHVRRNAATFSGVAWSPRIV